MKIVLITGCAGFIGSNLVSTLLKKKFKVIGIDNLSTGKKNNMKKFIKNKNFKFYKVDLLNIKSKNYIFKNKIEFVFHLAANADVRFGTRNPKKDLRLNTIATFNLLNEMKKNNIKNIIFSSTGSIYGEPNKFPTTETTSFPVQTSFYGASKLACESLIQAFCYGYDMQSWIFRFVSVLGENYSHGHVIDFYKQLMKNNKKLNVLGDGNQLKSYIDVSDCINGIMFGLNNSNKKVNIFNLGLNEVISVKQSIITISNFLKVSPKIIYSGGKRGWIGDSPKILLDVKKLRNLGWKPKYNIRESLKRTLKYLKEGE